MTSAQGRMRPTHPRAHRVDDIATAFGLRLVTGAVPDTQVTGLAVGSGDVVPGDLFVALRGLKRHGAEFAGQALAAGAVAVLTDDDGARLVGDQGVPVLVAEDPRALVGDIAAWAYGYPARDLVTVAVTGTNGKTTTAYFVDAAQRSRFSTTAVLGTVELRIGEESIESPRTTVEAPVLHAILARARERGAGAATVEASSHALALRRTGGVEFDVVGFTNLQRDHLDFHGDMDTYLADKARLFARGQAARGVVVVDDEWGHAMVELAQVPVETVATRPGPAVATADWAVLDADIGLDGVGSSFSLRTPDGTVVAAASPLPGLVNVSNAALAIVLAHRSGVELADAIAAVGAAHEIPGRMERVVERGEGWPLCLVDYAHTPDALELALQAVRPITPGRLVLVFGSDGDRDRGKRPIMGQVAARLADVLVVTDENPRSEDPASIRAAILEGVRDIRPDGRDVHEVSPRADAIRRGLELATDADTVIVTGKGHEPTQEIAGVFHRYNDRDVYLAARAERSAGAGS